MLSLNTNSTNGLLRTMKDKESISMLTNLVASTIYTHTLVQSSIQRSGASL